MEQGGQGSVWPSLFSFLRPELKLGPILTLRPKGKVHILSIELDAFSRTSLKTQSITSSPHSLPVPSSTHCHPAGGSHQPSFYE